MGETEKPLIFDFLYRDFSRLDSFFAQLFHGSLQSVVKTEGYTESIKKHWDANAKLFQYGRDSEHQEADKLEKRFDPHDQKILDILSALNIHPLVIPLEGTIIGKLVLVKGQLYIRNYRTINQAMPILFQVEAFRKSLGINKDTRKMIESLFNMIPMGLEVQLVTDNYETLVGSIKTEYLSENPDDLLRIYGSHIPGEWNILGILDRTINQDVNSTTSSLRDTVDVFAAAIRELYNESNEIHSIIPILIYRELSY